MSYHIYNRWRYVFSFSAIGYVQAGVAALITFLLADFLSVDVFGEYRFGITCLSIISVVGLFGAEKGLLVDLVQKPKKTSTILAFWALRIVVSVLGLLLLLAWLYFGDGADSDLLVAVVYGIAGMAMSLRASAWFDYQKRMRQHSLLLLLERMSFLFLLLALLYWYEGVLTALTIGILAIITITVQLLVEVLLIFNSILRNERPSWVDIKLCSFDIFRRYQWVWYLSLANLLMTSIGQLVLYQRTSVTELAYLGLALQFAAIARLFVQQTVRLQAPSIAKDTNIDTGRDELFNHLKRTLVRIASGGVILAIFIGFASEYILKNFFNGQYTPSISIVWVFMVWVQVLAVGMVINRYIISKGLQKHAFFVGLFFGLLCIAFTYELASEYGALGYSLVLICCHGASVLGQFMILRYKA